MLDMKWIRENKERTVKGLENKRVKVDVDSLLVLDDNRKSKLKEVENLKALLNKVNKEIGTLKKNKESADVKISEMKEVSDNIKKLDSELSQMDQQLSSILLSIPNIPHESVPVGGEQDNKPIRFWGEKRPFDFTPKPHWEIAEHLDIVDFKRGTKLSGSGFLLFKKDGARLERALINYFIETHCKLHGFEEVSPPFAVNRETMTGTGQLPKMEADMYRLEADDLFLVPTAEVPVTNIFRDEIFEPEELPKKYVAYTPCFRREAGSYGKETRGMVRIHQFDKVEMVAWVRPEESYSFLETLTGYAEFLLQQLGLPYQVVSLSTGDISFASSKTYDLEAWAPGMEKFLEVSSVSNFEDFQARRAKIRFRSKKGGAPALVHTLNGSGLALPRVFVSILENYQNADGSVSIPAVLQPYMSGQTRIVKKD